MTNKRKERIYSEGMRLPDIDAVVVKVEVRENDRPLRDFVRIRHGCCGREKTYRAKVLNDRRRPDTAVRNRKLCSSCSQKKAKAKERARNRSRRRVKEIVEPLLPFSKPPRWAVPSAGAQTASYYADTR
jgi:hypothetical protein